MRYKLRCRELDGEGGKKKGIENVKCKASPETLALLIAITAPLRPAMTADGLNPPAVNSYLPQFRTSMVKINEP